MINNHAWRCVSQATCGPDARFRRPLYDSYNFSRLPATLEYLLTGDEAACAAGLPADVLGPYARPWETVVMLFIDGFGWHLLQQYAPRLPFLQRLLEQGLASRITAMFPSTTAAHMTTLHTGRTPGQTGVWEWYYYEPVVDAVITPLLYSLATTRERDSLREHVADAEAILPGPRWYTRLKERGVSAHVFQDEKYAESVYSSTMFAGAERHGYGTVLGALNDLGDRILTDQGRRYYFIYIDGIDSRSHSHGLGTPDFEGQVEAVFSRIEEIFYKRLAGRVKDTLLIMSADHGQVPVNVEPTVYVNVELPEIVPMLRTTASGETIRFGGSGRDLFLYVKDERLDEAERLLAEHLAGRAVVWRTEAMIAEGLFGPAVTERLRQRLGNLVILPFPGRAVFWFEEGKFSMKHKGSHGGLSPEEMDTGVYLLPL